MQKIIRYTTCLALVSMSVIGITASAWGAPIQISGIVANYAPINLHLYESYQFPGFPKTPDRYSLNFFSHLTIYPDESLTYWTGHERHTGCSFTFEYSSHDMLMVSADSFGNITCHANTDFFGMVTLDIGSRDIYVKPVINMHSK